jgi:hypothetical protein
MRQSRPPGVSRRRFIHASGLASSAALVGACARTPPVARRLTVRGASADGLIRAPRPIASA